MTSNYAHVHYPGYHGDVTKHIVFTTVIKKMQAKYPEGIVIVDTHAGAGMYDLTAQSPPEYKKGIAKVLKKKEEAPNAVKNFIKASVGWSETENIEFYPGSPAQAQKLLRKQDEHRLSDLYISAMGGLQEDQSHFEQLDAWSPEAVDYFVGETDKHCVVLIDPPYEDDNDFSLAKDLMERILDVKPTATVMVWVPLINGSRFRWSALKTLKEVASKKAKVGQYLATCSVFQATSGASKNQLLGSAMFVANPTPEFDDVIDPEVLDWLSRTMTQGRGEYSVEQKMKKVKVKNDE
jgi:23S rRNA (adenine2030-N6)-methyltransferase